MTTCCTCGKPIEHGDRVTPQHGDRLACAGCSMLALRAYGWIEDTPSGPRMRRTRGPEDAEARRQLDLLVSGAEPE